MKSIHISDEVSVLLYNLSVLEKKPMRKIVDEALREHFRARGLVVEDVEQVRLSVLASREPVSSSSLDKLSSDTWEEASKL